jgi:hypothetical protein
MTSYVSGEGGNQLWVMPKRLILLTLPAQPLIPQIVEEYHLIALIITDSQALSPVWSHWDKRFWPPMQASRRERDVICQSKMESVLCPAMGMS